MTKKAMKGRNTKKTRMRHPTTSQIREVLGPQAARADEYRKQAEVLDRVLKKKHLVLMKNPAYVDFKKTEKRLHSLLRKAESEVQKAVTGVTKKLMNKLGGRRSPMEVALDRLAQSHVKEHVHGHSPRKSGGIEVEEMDSGGFNCRFDNLRKELARRGKDKDEIDETIEVVKSIVFNFSEMARGLLFHMRPCVAEGHKHPEILEGIILGVGMWIEVNQAAENMTEQETEEYLQLAKLIEIKSTPPHNVPVSKGSA